MANRLLTERSAQLVRERLLQLKAKDENTYEHSLRVGKLCEVLAGRLQLDEKRTTLLTLGGYLHDIGKMLIPDPILLKDSALTEEEWGIMKLHPNLGSIIMLGNDYVNQELNDIIELHHERLNGSGYPYGLQGDKIPTLARICAIADAFDSMVSDRPYRKGLPLQEAAEELRLHSGTQFDKHLVKVFLESIPSFREIYSEQ
ncbi:HD-GYP domain-containing protein [Paenibacillus filicis]|uniref:HD-GYP domain-containing protein n=1 Tax=Paenibacillus gyeongsangnamensis TaxID=3388067 RepID=A0ABT4QC38_9BACL|nr:HD-GYP domain-containing protein [Paenibacillus filicis]MCZ8514444.1 HD-GYP domain-containing protein [Paenibacillus filicis]